MFNIMSRQMIMSLKTYAMNGDVLKLKDCSK